MLQAGEPDRMVVHENAHEWFGNNITAKDPADRWIQEAFAGYAEELVMEDWYGGQAAEEFFLARSTGRIGNFGIQDNKRTLLRTPTGRKYLFPPIYPTP
jgi:aminopeptidase N